PDLPAAERAFRAAIASEPTSYQAHYRLALCLERAGRSDEAVEQHRKAQTLADLYHELTRLNGESMKNPADPAVPRRAAEVCRQLNRPKLAAVWKRAADIIDQRAAQKRPG